MKKQIFYYTDELTNEFSGIKRKTVLVDKNYKYIHNNIFYKITGFFIYRVFVMTFAFLYMKIKFRIKIENKETLKKAKKEGYFMYGNHTQIPGDGFIPNIANFPKFNAVLVNPDNVSLPGTKNIMMMLGAIPIPNDFSGMKNFMDCVSYNIKKNKSVVIYPEAHVWPYYTGIRNFKSDSFKFPILYDKKTFSFTVTYQQRKKTGKVNITVYVDGPFVPPKELSKKEKVVFLRNVVYETMLKRSEKSTYAVNDYIKVKK